MYKDIREEEIRRVREIKLWVQGMSDSPAIIDKKDDGFQNEKTNEKGLFFIFLYGIIESTVNQVVMETIKQLNASQVPINKGIIPLYTLALDREYKSLAAVGEKKWEKRWNISKNIMNNELIDIPLDAMPTDGKNIRYAQLDSIAKSFGIAKPAIPDPSYGGYLSTIVDNRNKIAHGDNRPSEIGRNYTIEELLSYVDITSQVCMYTIDIYEEYITKQYYLR